jgi:hypothetical protein
VLFANFGTGAVPLPLEGDGRPLLGELVEGKLAPESAIILAVGSHS